MTKQEKKRLQKQMNYLFDGRYPHVEKEIKENLEDNRQYYLEEAIEKVERNIIDKEHYTLKLKRLKRKQMRKGE